ncbi:hypothetical protein D3C78_1460200 [compost metagenome]
MARGQHLAHAHRQTTGDKGHGERLLIAAVQHAKAATGQCHHQHHQPTRIAQRANFLEASGHVVRVRQPVFRQNNDMLYLGHHLHIDAAIDVLARRRQAFAVTDCRQHHRIGRDRAFHAVHPQRPPQTGR